jgi:hypothetical protein
MNDSISATPNQGGTPAFPSAIDLTGDPYGTPVPRNGLVKLRVNQIFPAALNDKVYRPVVAGDPAIQALARNIKRNGLREPIVVTRDLRILSGHRRHAACKAAGLKDVVCRVEDMSSRDPEFLNLLVAYNDQRVKSFDEVIREQVVAASDTKSAYAALRNHRAEQSEVEAEFLEIGDRKVRSKITDAKVPMLEAIIKIIDAYREFWPLSDRSIHYYLLGDPPLKHASKPNSVYKNDRSSYQDTCDLLTRARLAGRISFQAISDPTRPITTWNLKSRTAGDFSGRELDGFLKGYYRDMMQSQANHVEILGEKNTIEGSIRKVAARYTIPYTIGRGYCSIDPVFKLVQRFKASGKDRLILLVMSDFDPEGESIPTAFAKQLRDDFGVHKIEAMKVCLTHEQVEARGLPRTFDVKKTSSRYDAFASKYGEDQSVHELEALPPEDRAELLDEAILSVIDVDAYNHELEEEEQDAARIEELRNRVIKAIGDVLGEAQGGTR